MSVKDWFSSNSWNNSMEEHANNIMTMILFTDPAERKSTYLAQETILCLTAIIGWLSSQVGNKVWNSIIGSIPNLFKRNASHHNTADKNIEKTETHDDMKTQPTHDSPVVTHEPIPTEVPELNGLNGLNGEITDHVSLIGASGANVAMMI